MQFYLPVYLFLEYCPTGAFQIFKKFFAPMEHKIHKKSYTVVNNKKQIFISKLQYAKTKNR